MTAHSVNATYFVFICQFCPVDCGAPSAQPSADERWCTANALECCTLGNGPTSGAFCEISIAKTQYSLRLFSLYAAWHNILWSARPNQPQMHENVLDVCRCLWLVTTDLHNIIFAALQPTSNAGSQFFGWLVRNAQSEKVFWSAV